MRLCGAAVLICLTLVSGAAAQERNGQPTPAQHPAVEGADSKTDPMRRPSTASAAKAQAAVSPSCKLAVAQAQGYDASLARVRQEATSLSEDDPGRCDALRRLRMLGGTRVALGNAAIGCGIEGQEAENAALAKEVDQLLASCPAVSPGGCSLSARLFAQATSELLQESALGIYANMATASDPRVCKYIRSMHGVLIEQRADADVIGQTCLDLLGQGSDEERAQHIAFIEARQRIERHEAAIKPRMAACGE